MKAISCEVILSGASTRADGSLGLRFSTPELRPEEMTAFFQVKGHNMTMLLQPLDGPDELVAVKGELDVKTPSQRLRSVLFIWWKQTAEPKPSFEEFYHKKMEAMIEHIKTKLEPEDIIP